jgi:hypothetical protein
MMAIKKPVTLEPIKSLFPPLDNFVELGQKVIPFAQDDWVQLHIGTKSFVACYYSFFLHSLLI